MPTIESPDVTALRQMIDAADHFLRAGKPFAARQICSLASSIIGEGSLDLIGWEGLGEDIDHLQAHLDSLPEDSHESADQESERRLALDRRLRGE